MPTPQNDPLFDALIIGAGPAGASCAVWLRGLGFDPVVVEAGNQAGGAAARSPYRNDWLVTSPGATGEALAAEIGRSLEDVAVDVRYGCRALRLATASHGFSLQTDAGGPPLRARRAVLAMGCRPVKGDLPDDSRILVGPGAHVFHHDFGGLDVAVLGGGDNGFENAAFARSKGARSVKVFARTIHARPEFASAVPGDDVSQGPYEVGPDGLTVNGRRFDRVLVMYGFRPDLSCLAEPVETDDRGIPRTDRETAETSCPGLHAIGEVAARMHPCVATAMADGVVAAKAIEASLRGRG